MMTCSTSEWLSLTARTSAKVQPESQPATLQPQLAPVAPPLIIRHLPCTYIAPALHRHCTTFCSGSIFSYAHAFWKKTHAFLKKSGTSDKNTLHHHFSPPPPVRFRHPFLYVPNVFLYVSSPRLVACPARCTYRQTMQVVVHAAVQGAVQGN